MTVVASTTWFDCCFFIPLAVSRRVCVCACVCVCVCVCRHASSGYEIFQDRTDGWKVTMKYFQNVVDIVRDLMSSTGAEKIYKEGMRKDNDGFMDIEWCSSAVLNSWDDLRKVTRRRRRRRRGGVGSSTARQAPPLPRSRAPRLA